MEILSAEYSGSFIKIEDCPPPKLPEYAFIGRSNVGKSSLINMLTGRKGLAHVSNTPGKTQTINYFLINEDWHLIDLPGYGYARTNKSVRAGFIPMIADYLIGRETMLCCFVLIDVNVEPKKNDIEFLNFLGENQVPFVIAYTKADRLSKSQLHKSLTVIREKLLESWETLPQEFITSAEHRTGKEDVLNFIGGINKAFKKQKP
ncbi:MAG: YihA family ribosome biogenesis GTP-binding protein [Saprospiraceae bacterium]|nr:YihA family ribosome biogenesis GTP-binding protein [Saprospiraceae bacterium]